MCFHSASLFNYALYLTRKQWEHTHTFLQYETGYFTYKDNSNYKSSQKIFVNTDVNGVTNIVRKAIGDYSTLSSNQIMGGLWRTPCVLLAKMHEAARLALRCVTGMIAKALHPGDDAKGFLTTSGIGIGGLQQ